MSLPDIDIPAVRRSCPELVPLAVVYAVTREDEPERAAEHLARIIDHLTLYARLAPTFPGKTP